jgi:hypothetical protein
MDAQIEGLTGAACGGDRIEAQTRAKAEISHAPSYSLNSLTLPAKPLILVDAQGLEPWTR